MIILFDLNGTLAKQQKTGTRGWLLRPGATLLSRLQRRGVRIGLFTNKTRRNIPLGLFQSVGVSFDIVLDQDHCEECTSLETTYSRQKSLVRHFPVETTSGTIRLVDDDSTKGMSGEEHLLLCLPKWEGDMDDVALSVLLETMLNGDLGL
jgi:hypothetical protein